MKETVNVSTEDLFFFDQERLQTIADRMVISRGLEDHKENRVMEIDQDQDLLWGQVEGADPDVPNDVTIRLAESQTYYDAAEKSEEQAVPRLVVMAAEKLKAATVLMEQQIFSGAIELLVSALLAAAAGRAGLDTPVTAQDAGVWIYGEALAKGLLSQEEAALIMRAVSLSQSPSVPEPLLADLRMDVEAFVDQA